MSLPNAVIDAMLAAGCSAEQLAAAMKAANADNEARKEAKRAGNAERQQRFRDRRKVRKQTRNDSNALRDVTPPIEDHTPQSVISSNDEKQTQPRKQRGPVCVRPDDIPEQLWGDWVAHRTKHRADAGQTTLDAYRREADRVGWTLEQALTEQISRGWRGFKAKWVQDDGRNQAQFGQSARPSLVDIGRAVAADLEREAQARAGF